MWLGRDFVVGVVMAWAPGGDVLMLREVGR